MLENLRKTVSEANQELYRSGLIRLSWGSVSGIDRKRNLIAITPDDLSYESLTPNDLVIIDMSGKVIQGKHEASRDAFTHIELYKNFPEIGGVTHTHSVYATIFAQANREIPIYGTMHCDYFADTISVTPKHQLEENNEHHTTMAGKDIIKTVAAETVMKTPGILIHGDGPITWGEDPIISVKNAKAMEAIAEIAFGTCILNIAPNC
ncbi:MAG: class II aldolase/adducin family protein [Kiritimatiellae bacterium]|nr:class II aldolase/adducin family protein [Kiritimatiellia bacterium]